MRDSLNPPGQNGMDGLQLAMLSGLMTKDASKFHAMLKAGNADISAGVGLNDRDEVS